jgi:endoglucanase
MKARNHFLNYVTQTALKNGLTPVYWDAGNLGDKGSALFDRKALKVVFKDAVQAITGVVIPGNDNFPNNATTLAKKLGIGWNLGNALESCNGATSASETLWGNPATTKALIEVVNLAGFTTVRIPAAWSRYIEDQKTYKLKDSWLARVSEVIGYVIDNGMYAIVNIHWDGGWLEEHPTYADQKNVTAKLSALWKQIATYLNGFDEHLLFAGANEIRSGYGNPTAENLEVHQSYLQTFVDTVRSTGGNNAYRNLIIQGYRTDIQLTVNNLKLPKDSIIGRLFVEVHYYDPWDFTGEGGNVYVWGKEFSGDPHVSSWGQEDWVDQAFALLKTSFVEKGVPVIIGEYSAMYRASLTGNELTKHIRSRNHFFNNVTQVALKDGITPIYWDNGNVGDKGNGLFDRKTNTIVFNDAVSAITGLKSDALPHNDKIRRRPRIEPHD